LYQILKLPNKQLRGADLFLRSEHFIRYSKIPPHISCNRKVPYFFHKGPPHVPVLSQINPVHAPIFISFKFTLPSPPTSSKRSLSLRFPLYPCVHLSSPPYVSRVLPISVFLISSPEQYSVRDVFNLVHKMRKTVNIVMLIWS